MIIYKGIKDNEVKGYCIKWSNGQVTPFMAEEDLRKLLA
jgi:hypothetical protein